MQRKRRQLTLGSIAGLVVLCEPPQVEVLNPGHPPLVLLVVDLLSVLAPGLLLLFLVLLGNLGNLGSLRRLEVGHFCLGVDISDDMYIYQELRLGEWMAVILAGSLQVD